ncbi:MULTISPECIES: hypothetical protein [Pseudonocardiaceae]|uniref:Uncharacterized protein n=1 Tax=Prauserella muralis TaxID=588067 RepID=A0A2V4AE33_9PSEU|nr:MULTISPECIES: hypothetical protein [Pseudonocardiaceae]OLZ45569.1 hypothetical protein BS330_39005 [Amycolatopsis keratiniphila subsp. nogabecina]PXY17665.1 hypothetical protein BAY60_34210 [Prauserella muralis]
MDEQTRPCARLYPYSTRDVAENVVHLLIDVADVFAAIVEQVVPWWQAVIVLHEQLRMWTSAS